MENAKIAVIGLGSMGLGMARSLLRRGWDVCGVDLSTEARNALAAAGGRIAETPQAAVDGCQIVLSVVVNAQQTETILFGPGGVAAAMTQGSVFVSSATMMPKASREFADRLASKGILYLDAPISGGAVKADAGELSVMASGAPEAFDIAEKMLADIAQKVFRLGDKPGVGASVKMINQLLAGVHIAAACEAMALAAKLDLDLPQVYEVIKGSAGNSWMFENRVPHILDGDYAPLSAVEIFVKDLGIIQDMARAERYPAPVAAAALQMFLATSGAGMGGDDDASVARLYASLSDVDLPAPKARG